MRKIFQILFFTFVFMISTSTQIAWADSLKINLTARESEESPGIYEAIVSVSDSPGIAAFNLGIKFDKVTLTPIAIREGSAIAHRMVFASNISGTSEEEKSDLDVVTALMVSSTDITDNGILYTVLFRASPTANGQTELTLFPNGVKDANDNDISLILMGDVIDFDISTPINKTMDFADFGSEIGEVSEVSAETIEGIEVIALNSGIPAEVVLVVGFDGNILAEVADVIDVVDIVDIVNLGDGVPTGTIYVLNLNDRLRSNEVIILLTALVMLNLFTVIMSINDKNKKEKHTTDR
jgi:hypothetical protein